NGGNWCSISDRGDNHLPREVRADACESRRQPTWARYSSVKDTRVSIWNHHIVPIVGDRHGSSQDAPLVSRRTTPHLVLAHLCRDRVRGGGPRVLVAASAPPAHAPPRRPRRRHGRVRVEPLGLPS